MAQPSESFPLPIAVASFGNAAARAGIVALATA
jgi:hypothetical protein